MMTKIFLALLLVTLLVLGGCATYMDSPTAPGALNTISIIDRNGLSQTISTKERLKQYQEVDFLKACPYQKVMRVYNRDGNGDVYSCLTSYHPNGQLCQYLDVVNSRACGMYQEWYANGQMKLEAQVIGGPGDLTPGAQGDWLFEGTCYAWDEEGNVIGDIPYEKGVLEGEAKYYYSCGQTWKKIPYTKGGIHGIMEIYAQSGELIEKSEHCEGLRHGVTTTYWPGGTVSGEECYYKGLLEKACYYSKDGTVLSSIVDGQGRRTVWKEDGSYEKQEYAQGVLDGKIEGYDQKGTLITVYCVKNGVKNGDEIYYFTSSPSLTLGIREQKPKPKVSIPWFEGKVQGIARSWYDNGVLESQREFSDNVRHGLSTAWYRNGSLMLIEEYNNDKLVKGEYHRSGETSPSSRVIDGKGICSLFDGNGHFIRKINYSEGKPVR